MATKQLKGVCIGAGYFAHFQYEAWQRIPEVEIVAFSNRDQTRADQPACTNPNGDNSNANV